MWRDVLYGGAAFVVAVVVHGLLVGCVSRTEVGSVIDRAKAVKDVEADLLLAAPGLVGVRALCERPDHERLGVWLLVCGGSDVPTE